MENWPFEMLEMIVVKSCIMEFVNAKFTEDPDPEKTAVKKMMSVCQSWTITITGREYTKRQLRYTFEGFC
jgi:hypothetical protein